MMKLSLTLLAAVLLPLGSLHVACAAEDGMPPAATESAESPLVALDVLEAYRADTTKPDTLHDFGLKNLELIEQDMQSNPARAGERIAAIKEVLETVDPKATISTQMVLNSLGNQLWRLKIELGARETSQADIEARMVENPDDFEAISLLTMKLRMVFDEELGDDLDKMEQYAKAAQQFSQTQQQRSQDAKAERAYKSLDSRIEKMIATVDRERAFLGMIGKEMYPIVPDAWINGQGPTPEEMKGKVILLDFWALWCGPCIAGFPHMVDLQEKYGSQGLQVVGVTTYYKIDFSGQGIKPEDMTPELEQVTLKKLVADKELNYPTAVLAESEEAYDFYSVTAIPELVLIGRDGKIRLVEVGIGEEGLAKLDETIQKLLAE
ncbi:TlpA disulfide reductase family protein [Bremerella cremea]|uniref:TlpA family protein disulfide reductase n=1 Tax=Bremerella cremea TaxID=1031537 RepID=UPI0031EBFACD